MFLICLVTVALHYGEIEPHLEGFQILNCL